MSEQGPSTSPPEAPPPPPPPRAGAPRASDTAARLLALVAVAGAAAAGWFALEARHGLQAVEARAGAKLGELGSEAQQSKAALAQAQTAIREAQVRIAELESRVADTHEQRVALEEMYRELSRSADDRVLSEVEQMIVLASQQLQLAGNVRAALAALQAADQRLARAEKLAAAPLRRAIGQDIEKLKAVPQLDTAGLALRIDQVIQQAETLPLVIAETPPQVRVTRARGDEATGFARAARDFWQEMKSLVRIRELETPDAALITPSQAYFLRENVKLRLLAARMSLLARDEAAFREDMRAVQAWVARYFDVKAKPTQAALATLKQVAETPVTIAVPDVNTSLAAVRTARAAREKR